MNIVCKRSSLAILTALAMAGFALPAFADDRDHDRDRDRDHYYRHHPAHYAPPPRAYYARPPVVYAAPPPVAPWINLMFNFR